MLPRRRSPHSEQQWPLVNEILKQFTAVLSIPNVASDHENIRPQNLWDGIELMATSDADGMKSADLRTQNGCGQ